MRVDRTIRRDLAVGIAAIGIGLAPPKAIAQTVAKTTASVEGGAFIGGNLLESRTGLGNAFFSDQVPRSLSALFGIRGAWRFLPRLALESELQYSPTRTRGDVTQGRPGISASLVGARLHLRYTMLPQFALRPLVVAGIGINGLIAAPPSRYGMDRSDFDPTAYWGLGAEYVLGETPFGVRFDLRQAVGSGRQGVAFEYQGHLGVVFGIAGTRRTDRMALVDGSGQMTSKQLRGDIDGDGVPNNVDKCPNEPELPNGIDDTDGCPEVDSDGDGVLGSADACPEIAEDSDGFNDEDGCPDPDNDADGIEDAADACPNIAEPLNGFDDSDGCPDEVPTRLQPFTGVIPSIQFEPSSATIYAESIPILDQAVAVFRDFPRLGIEVHGHTDPIGADQVNNTLALQRAEAVKAYLVDHGIAADRIVTIGHGARQPVTRNTTEEGRARNRRIELRLRSMPQQSPVEM